MVSSTMRAELTRLEAGLYNNITKRYPLATGERMAKQYFALLKECGAPVDVRVHRGEWQFRLTGKEQFEAWWSEHFPDKDPLGLTVSSKR